MAENPNLLKGKDVIVPVYVGVVMEITDEITGATNVIVPVYVGVVMAKLKKRSASGLSTAKVRISLKIHFDLSKAASYHRQK